MNGTGDGRNGRRRRRRRGNFGPKQEEKALETRRQDKTGSQAAAKNKARADRPRWVPPRLETGPMPESDCAYCGKPIQDMGTAIQDKISGGPVHFDCVLARLSEAEKLDRGDVVSYIGGGRFAVVHFGGQDSKDRFQAAYSFERGRPGAALQLQGSFQETAGRVFTIKKVFEWEDKEQRPDWRLSIADHYSIT